MRKIYLSVLSGVVLVGIGVYAWVNQWKEEKIGQSRYRTNIFTNKTERFEGSLGWISMEQAQQIDAEQAEANKKAYEAGYNSMAQAAIFKPEPKPSADFSDVNVQLNLLGANATGTATLIKSRSRGGNTVEIVLYDKSGKVVGTGSTMIFAQDGDKVPFNIVVSMNGNYPQGSWSGTYEISIR